MLHLLAQAYTDAEQVADDAKFQKIVSTLRSERVAFTADKSVQTAITTGVSSRKAGFAHFTAWFRVLACLHCMR